MMFRVSRKGCALIAVFGVYFLFRYMDSLWSLSIDVAHHYLLAFRLSEQWNLDPTTSDMGVMGFYPKGAHIMAAVLGEFLNSTLAGMQAVSILGLLLLWGSVLFILTLLPGRHAFLAPVILALLLFINYKVYGFEVHGAEIIGNYFYSQLVAQALAFLAIGLAIRAELSGKRRSAYWIIWSGCIAIAFVHLLPALELLGVLCGVMLLDLISERETRRKALLAYLGIAVLAVLSMYFHPSFSAMRKIAENNGALDLRLLSYPLGIMTLCLAVFLGSAFCCVWIIGKRIGPAHQAIKYLGALGVVVSTLCILQYVALQFGYGSDYAIKKYGFGLATQAFILVAISLSWLAHRFLPVSFWERAEPKIIGFPLAVVHVVLFAIFVVAAVPNYKGFDVSDFVRLERQMVHLRENILPELPVGKSNAVVDIAAVPATLDYMFSVAMGSTPLLQAVKDVLRGPISDLSKYEYIIESASTGRYAGYGCPSLTTGTIAVLSASCLQKAEALAAKCMGKHDLSGVQSEHVLTSGFGVREAAGRWTNGKSALFECNLSGDSPRSMKLTLSPFVYGTHLKQRVSISVNGSAVGLYELSGGQTREIDVRLPSVASSGKLHIGFEMPDAVSPEKLGVSEDSRVLGLFFNTIQFD